MLEIAGAFDEFVTAVRKIDGLEYLAEEVGDRLEETEEFAIVDHQTGRRRAARRELFVVATDERAAAELERLWGIWQSKQPLPHGYRRFATMFDRLVSLRYWNDEDRLVRTGAVDRWREELADAGDDPIPFEVELWFRGSEDVRAAYEERLERDMEAKGGRIIDRFTLEDIRYHGVIAELPASLLRATAEDIEAAWLSGRGVRFLRAAGQASVPIVEDVEEAPAPTTVTSPVTGASPRVALLDGVVLAGHELLDGRVLIDDPDGWEETEEVRHRQHGTAMASTILHGDLAAEEDPLSEPLYVRPVMRVDPRHSWVPGVQQVMPVERLPVEILHTAVVRMLEGENATAPGVKVINLSIADAAQAFDRFVSPLARLIDHLAARYEVLFLVSAGNHDVEVVLPPDVDLDAPDELEAEVLAQLARTATLRRLLAPAESVNALTVGAAHSDAGELAPDGRLSLLVTEGLPGPLSGWGSGLARAIKPDVLAPGGREAFEPQPDSGDEAPMRLLPSRASSPPGIRVATPARGGDLRRTTWISGTSPATALGSRAAVQVLVRLDQLRVEWASDMTVPDTDFDAVLSKALLVHGACWGRAGTVLRRALVDATLPATREDVQRALGYGLVRPDWPLVDDDHRLTAFYASRLRDGEHEYRLPLPPALSGRTEWRRVTVTLAWFTPVNPAHREYRRAAMRVDATGSQPLATTRQEASNNAVVRGTVQHEVLEGEDAVPYADGADLLFTVSCRPAAGALDEDVPYAFVVTLETAEQAGIPVYAEVATRLRQRAAARARARVPA